LEDLYKVFCMGTVVDTSVMWSCTRSSGAQHWDGGWGNLYFLPLFLNIIQWILWSIIVHCIFHF